LSISCSRNAQNRTGSRIQLSILRGLHRRSCYAPGNEHLFQGARFPAGPRPESKSYIRHRTRGAERSSHGWKTKNNTPCVTAQPPAIQLAGPSRFSALPVRRRVTRLMLCIAITAIAMVLQYWEEAAFGHAYVEALVIAILLGIALAVFGSPEKSGTPAFRSAPKRCSKSRGAVRRIDQPRRDRGFGPALLSASLRPWSLRSPRVTRQPRARLAAARSILIACGNSICGNSAIAAVAPVIGADSDDVASSIAFTANSWRRRRARTAVVHSVAGAVRNAIWRAGGLDVYACRRCSPRQCRSAPSVRSSEPGQTVRVLMLGPVVVLLSLFRSRLGVSGPAPRPGLLYLVPWFIIGFLVLATARSLGLIRIRCWADHDLAKSADGDIDGRTGTWRRSARRRPRRRPRHGRGGGFAARPHRHQHRADPAAPHR